MANIKEMLDAGMTVEQIKAMVDQEAAARTKANSNVSKTRERAISAVLAYFVELGVISQEDVTDEDFKAICEAVENAEKEFADYIKFAKMMGIIESKKESAAAQEKPAVKTVKVSDADAEALARFLSNL